MSNQIHMNDFSIFDPKHGKITKKRNERCHKNITKMHFNDCRRIAIAHCVRISSGHSLSLSSYKLHSSRGTLVAQRDTSLMLYPLCVQDFQSGENQAPSLWTSGTTDGFM